MRSATIAATPKEAVAIANRFAAEEVDVVIGHVCSSSSIPASDIYWESDILQITPSSTAPALTDRGYENVFRVCGRDDQQGDFAGAWLAENFSGPVAFVHDKSAYGKGLADRALQAFEAAGQEAALYEAINAGEQDYSALVSKLKNLGAEALYFGGYHAEFGLIARQASEQGYKPQFVSGDGQVVQELWAITGEAGEGMLFTFGPDPRTNPAASRIVERIRRAGFEPEGYTLYAYAAVQAWGKAAGRAGTTEAEAVAAALREGSYETVIGSLAFDENGDREDIDYTWYRWQSGNYEEVGRNYAP